MEMAVAADRWPVPRLRSPVTFSTLLLLGTVLPIGLMMVAYELVPQSAAVFQPGLTALAFLGGGHVAITFWFYLDRRSAALMSHNKWFYYGLPAVVMASTCAIYVALDPESRKYGYAIFSLTAMWHHARQNIGVYSFLSRSWKLGPASPVEKTVLSFSFIGAIFAGVRWYGLPSVTPAVEAVLYNIGLACFIVVFAAAAFYGVREYGKHHNVKKTFLFLALAAFFVPAILFKSPAAAASFGAAHGVQYYLFLFYAMYRSPEKVREIARLPTSRLGWTAAILIAGIWPTLILFGLSDAYRWLNTSIPNHMNGGVDTVVFGLVMGWVFTHYIVDAGVWKMSDPKVREYHKDAFAFLR